MLGRSIWDRIQTATGNGTEQQAESQNVLQNKLDVSKENAEMLASYIKQAQAGQVEPVAHFIVQASSLPTATQQVVELMLMIQPCHRRHWRKQIRL